MITSALEKARHNMIEQQIRPWNVLDEEVLKLLDQMKREAFVPEPYRGLAYADLEIPLQGSPSSSTIAAKMWQPKLEARVLQHLQAKPKERVLEIGTGSGYFAALLAQKVDHVLSIEIDPALHLEAKKNLHLQGIYNTTLREGNGILGWSEEGPYDIIVFTGALPTLPPEIEKQLTPNGRVFAVIGEFPIMQARLYRRNQGLPLQPENLFETSLDPLLNPEHLTSMSYHAFRF